jgi:hypothetical protein
MIIIGLWLCFAIIICLQLLLDVVKMKTVSYNDLSIAGYWKQVVES